VRGNTTGVWLGSQLIFFGIQAALTQRIVRKNYRTFRVWVIRDDGRAERRLSRAEGIRVWLWILGPQLAFVLILSIIVRTLDIQPDTLRSVNSLSQLLRFLVVGPYSVNLAVRAEYPGFRLQPCGYRYF